MVENVLNVAGLLLGLGCTIIWIIALMNGDGAGCDRSDCARCPFPCEEHNKKHNTEV